MGELRARCMVRHPEIGVRCEMEANHVPGAIHCCGDIAWTTVRVRPTPTESKSETPDG